MTSEQDTVRIIDTITLSDNWYILKKYVVDYLRRDGTCQRLEREVYDRGNGAVILLYNRQKNSVILIRQFRLPVYVNGHDGFLIEAAAGLLEEQDPVSRIKAEAEEETGFRITDVEKVFEAFMSPGSVTEKLYFFIAEYQDNNRQSDGGGLPEEGEDVEVLEMPFPEALTAIRNGEIIDGKTIMLLQHLALSGRMA
ncbi:NUDIX domain-containing protein [Morganella morganii]|uniref:NUDIX domain-containing protein n=1 Tax=Morganella morganii TaxID=582 RepID=UPI00062C36FD|nr:NUDIX domain-containing protein [Morganella morganii]BEP21255.1 NUDIX domain-containing protein [Morganella morganii subsp. sibonii]HDS6842254.1 NUDIX domain-containing protein [Morganella morganii subsp. morganii]EKK5568396.1 NUDIX domain-containing protein [Morganella morganii]ELB1543475.1 NUDIX domain-containing protein [Morganella morganii]KKY67487.1 GDP-mannose pyrophosphatase [Morganella morganii]